MSKTPTSVRLSDDGKRLLQGLAGKLGISQASVIELALRTLAKREGIR